MLYQESAVINKCDQEKNTLNDVIMAKNTYLKISLFVIFMSLISLKVIKICRQKEI